MISSRAFTSLAIDAPGVDPKLLQLLVPLSEDALVSMIHQAFPISPSVDDPPSPGLVFSDGSSQRYVGVCSAAEKPDRTFLCSYSSPSYSPPSYDDLPSFPHHDHNNYDHSFSPTTSASSASPRLPAERVLAEAPCAGGTPVKQKDGGYHCSHCRHPFKRRDDAKRHIESAGKRVQCRYCGKSASGRRDGQGRHLFKNKNCLKEWKVGYEAGRFTERSREDAYR